ncbi:MAG TPA: hypothetical protein VG164_03115 [Trebonia sp.]|nr:hypothetical protein [Trebonia sp.]
MRDPKAVETHGCTCPDAGPDGFVVIVPAARPAYPGADYSDDEWHDFLGAGPAEAEAVSDAERHALEFLGDDAHLRQPRPA